MNNFWKDIFENAFEDHSWTRAPTRLPLKRRLRRFDLVQDKTEVWDFGRPETPRTCLEYKNELGLHSGYYSMSVYNEQQSARAQYEAKHSRSVVTKELIDVLAEVCQGKVVEPFAGSGWLAAHLRHRGIDMLALDNGSMAQTRTWTRIDDLDVVKECSDANVIIMQWPPHHVVAQRIVMTMQRHELLLYLGPHALGGMGDKLPTAGFWHHLSRSDHDVRLEQKLQRVQPIWAGQNAKWQAFIKR